MAAKKFKFRLEPLLKIREHREKERQKDHAAAVGKVHEQKDAVEGIDNERISTMDYQRGKSVGRLLIAEALVYSRYLMRLKRERIAGVELLHGLQKEAEQKRQELVEAARERKIFDLLKEKQQQRHREEAEKADQKELDEVAVGAYRRRKK
jgi:flagellar FliJ protein